MKISFSKISVILSGLVHLGLILLLLASGQSSTLTSELEVVEFILYESSEESDQEVRIAQVRIPKQKILQSEVKEETVNSVEEFKPEELGSAYEDIAQAASEGSSSNTQQARLAENAQELYIAEVIRHLNSQKRYPEIARKLRQQGRVILEFRLSKDGSVLEAKIKEPSTYQLLNESAESIVKNLKNLRPFPEEVQRTTWLFTVPVDYQL